MATPERGKVARGARPGRARRARPVGAFLALVLLVCAPLVLLAPRAQAQGAPVTPVSVDLSEGFARIVFDLADRPKAKAEIAFGVMVLVFEEPLRVDLDRLQADLAPYVSMVRQDADGRTLRFALRGPLKLNQTVVGRQLAIDLLPPRYKSDPPRFVGRAPADAGAAGAAQATVARAPFEAADRREIASFAAPKPLEDLPIRIGVEPTFTRIVFDWRDPVDYTVDHHRDHVTIRFARPARVDLAELRVDPPRFVKGARTEQGDGSLAIVLAVAEELEVRDFRDGNKIALDLTPRAPADAVAPATGHAPATDGEALAAQAAPTAPKPALPAGGDAAAVLSGKAAPPPSGALPAAHGAHGAAPGEPAHGTPGADQTHAEAADPLAEPAAVPPPVMAGPGEVVLSQEGQALRLSVGFAAPAPAAVFRRGDWLWLVFEAPETLLAPMIERWAQPLIAGIDTQRVGPLAILRAELRDDAMVEADLDGTRWTVRLTDTVATAPDPILITREVRPAAGPRLRLRAEAKGLHWIEDPAAGDYLLVATAGGPARAVLLERRFVELVALATAQGAAVIPYSENIAASLDEGDVVVETRIGLAVTASESVDRGSTKSPVERIARPGFLDFAGWKGAGLAGFTQTRQDLERQIVMADARTRDLKRMDLARYYLANGFAPEALGLLGLMAQDDPRVLNAPAYHAARGAALLMMGRAREAEEALGHGSLANERDILPWQAAAAAARGRWAAAAAAFLAAEGDLAQHVPDWQARFRLWAAEAALNRNDPAMAARFLAGLSPEALDAALRAGADYLHGRVYESQGRTDEALARYDAAIKGPRGLASARARLADATLRVGADLSSEGEAIEALERLRYDWRGDALELDTLSALGKLYIADRRYREGFSIMRAAIAHFPNSPAGGRLEQDMRQAFKALFLEGAADALPPVDALGLYYDYRALTPVGRDGDDMIRRLAERLIAIDLLPQAAELLQHQVDNRLKGAAKSQVATRLAMVYLMDHKAEEALRAIRGSRQAQLPDWLNAQRRLLEARALGELKQYDFALEVLLQDDSIDASRVRADVYWAAENWPAAAESIEAVLGDRWREADKPLEADERLLVMRAALAYLFAKNAFGSEQLRARYGVLMKEGPEAANFDLVTLKPDATSPDLREVAKQIASVDTLDAFMKAFRDRHSGETAALPSPAESQDAPRS